MYCLTNHKQKAYELLAPDGCFDIQLSTIVKGFVFSAAFGYSSLQDEFGKYCEPKCLQEGLSQDMCFKGISFNLLDFNVVEGTKTKPIHQE